MLNEILDYNKHFVAQKAYEHYQTKDKYPAKKIAIVSCMDTRLTELLPAALGIKNGDAKFIQNAGGVISHPLEVLCAACSSPFMNWGPRNTGHRTYRLRCPLY